MRCPHCQSPMSSDDARCPDCGRPLTAQKTKLAMWPTPSRWLAVTACVLAAPAWLCGLSYLTMVSSMGGEWWHGWVAGAVLWTTMAALVAAMWWIDWLGRVQILACLVLWVCLLYLITPRFGIFGVFLLIPLEGLAALAVILGAFALLLHWRCGWPARLMALLACAGLPLMLGSLSLLGSAHAVHEARLWAESKRRPPMALPAEQRRYFVRTETNRGLSLPQKTFCVVAPAGGPVPTPEEAAGLVGPIAAEDIRPGTFLLRLGFDPGSAYYERVARIEHPVIGREGGSAVIPESWPYQQIGVVYPGESYLTPKSGRADAQPIPVGDVRVGMYLQICEGRVPTVGVLLSEPIKIHYEKVIEVEFAR
jgi:hypothetical protein